MKQKLLDLIEAGRAKEHADLVKHVDNRPPAEQGQWTAKDQLAHLTAWREIAIAELNAGRTGAEPPDISNDDDVENAKTYARTHPLPAAAILESASHSWDELASAVEACSEEDLTLPRSRQPGQALWQTVPNNAYFHLAEHIGYWYTETGDQAAAEAVAKWGYELIRGTFDDDRQRGVAAYNLGCFYAARGRAGEAMPYLRDGIRLRPDLREWARQDRDLDPIRSDPDLVRLLE